MLPQDEKEYNLKILALFALISSILALSVLAMGYYQENKFEKITANSYIKRYETLLLEFINNSIDKLNSNVINYTRNNSENRDMQNSDYLLVFKNSQFLFGKTKQNKKVSHNPLWFIPNSNISGIIKLHKKLYLYSSYKNQETDETVAILRSFSFIPTIKDFGKIVPKPIVNVCKIKKIGHIYAGLCNKSKKGYVVIADIFKKPVATVIISPRISDIYTAHYKTIFQILLFTVIAIIISALISYIIIKKAVLDNINLIIESIKNIRHDFTYIKPGKLKDRQFLLLADTLEWLTTRIKESEYLFNKIANLIPMGIIVYKTTPIYANKYAIQFFEQDIVGIPIINFVNEKHKKMIERIKSKRNSGNHFYASYTIEMDKPKSKVIRVSSTTIKYRGEFAGLMAFMDITKNERAKKLYKVINKVSDIIIKTTDEKDMLKNICATLISHDNIKAAWISKNDITNVLFSCGDFDNAKEKIINRNLSSAEEKIHMENSKDYSIAVLPISIKNSNEYFIGIYSDIKNFFDHNTKSIISQIKINLELAIEHMRTQREKTRMLFYDTLTGLKNFNSLKTDISEVSSCVLIYMNIKNFSVINQIYGFEFSDEIIRQIGYILRKNVKSTDNVYRLHGDKFAILIKKEINKNDVEKLIVRLQKKLIDFELDSRKIPIHTDVGITMFPSLTKTQDKIVESVEVALTKSKETKRICFYSDEMQKDIEENFNLETYTRAAIEKRLFSFHYQPILNIKSGNIEKAEALIRLKDENGNFINPEKFISIAEKVNIISDLSQIVIEHVFKEVAKLKNIGISINLSSKDIENPKIVSLIEENLAKNKMKPRSISIELTERDIMHNFISTKMFIEKLKKSNIEIEIDDFGIGYSSFDRIVDLDFDVLKIDKSLVDLIGTNQKAEQIITYIVKLAHSLNAKALAEGIETKEQFEFLSNNDCDYIQGYYISKPLPFNEFIAFINNNS